MAARQAAGGQYFLPPAERGFDEKPDLKLFDAESNGASVSSLRKILQMNAQTSEEKFKVLDARDKLYKIMKDRDPSLSRGALVATCPDMCPEKERLLREYQGRGSIFEMINYSKNSSFSHSLAVKEYARSSADQEEPLPHDLRPVHILTMTMSHLLHNVVDFCELSDDNLEEWYMFMWDRTRALRKELTQQGVYNLESVTLVEQCARFHIHCAERLVDQDSAIYDDKINTENLTKCLQTLKYMYKDLAKEDIKCPNEPEFICYSLLLNLNNSSVFTELSEMPNSLMTSDSVKFALNVMTTWETRNYIRFFNLVKNTTYLNCCLLRRYFGEMRLYAIKTMIRSYCTKNYSPQILISRFVEILNFEGEEECLNFLSFCNFNFHDVDGRTIVNFDRVLFQNPKASLTSGRAYLFIEEKKRTPVSVVIAGGSLPRRLFDDYVPHSSFTPSGDLDPELSPQKELLEFFSVTSASKGGLFDAKVDSYKSPLDGFPKGEQTDIIRDPRLQKRQEELSQSPLFSVKDKNPPTANIFGSVQPPSFATVPDGSNIFGSKFSSAAPVTTGSVFDYSDKNVPPKNIFETQGNTNLFGNNRGSIFYQGPKAFPAFGASHQEGKDAQINVSAPSVFPVGGGGGGGFGSSLQWKLDEEKKLREEKEQREKLERERLEKERVLKEKEEEEKKRKEEEMARIRLEEKRLQEENRRKEMERREREKKEEEERRKREELAKREREELLRREEKARQEREREAKARHLAELKKQEESRRKIELEYKLKVDTKISELREKMQKWKTKVVFDKWRMKTWSVIEGRKMAEYFKEVKLKYPPVCPEELLNGNPYGLIIPNSLTFEKFRNWGKEVAQTAPKKLLIVNDELPLLKVTSALGKPLEDRAKRLGCNLEPFPWKLIISVPDAAESPSYWKSIETFVEMHFVDRFDWRFGVQKGPLYCREGCRGSFRFHVSVRRLRGCQLHEGSEVNPSATAGSNALVFFVADTGMEMAHARLKTVLKSRAPLPKIPVVVIVLSGESPSSARDVVNLLEMDPWKKSHVSECHVVSVDGCSHRLVGELSKCLVVAATCSAAPSSLRLSRLSDFFSGTWLDSLWRRVEISLSNYKVTLHEPKVLIQFYNSCLEELAEIFFDKNYDERTVLGEEFSGFAANPPKRTPKYEEKLRSLLDRVRLPHWPVETPKSSHQLNYRIHQYCKKVTGQERAKLKNLKWLLYRIIRKCLLWKGLDIYCDEDIREILVNFPWIQVFQEISRVMIRQLTVEIKDGDDLTVIYDVDRVSNFSFEQSLVGKFLIKSKRRRKGAHVGEEEEELEELSPCLEKDSVVYAYSAAIERESGKRKREECVEEGLDALFSTPAGKRLELEEEAEAVDYSDIEAGFQSLDDRLSEMKKRLNENYRIILDVQNQM